MGWCVGISGEGIIGAVFLAPLNPDTPEGAPAGFPFIRASLGGGSGIKVVGDEIGLDTKVELAAAFSGAIAGAFGSSNTSKRLDAALLLLGGGMALGRGDGGAGHLPRAAAVSNRLNAR